jgi:hypothetical protein
MSSNGQSTIIAVTSDDASHRNVVDRAVAVARQSGSTVILYDLGVDLGPFESALPTDWSGDGQQEQFGDRLDPGDLEAAGQTALADQVRIVRAAGVEAFGWLPPKADPGALAEYAAGQGAELILVSTEDAELIEAFRDDPTVDEAAVGGATDGPPPPPRERIHVEAVPPS